MAVDTRPTFLTADHNYNLRNQGWPNKFALAPNPDGNGLAVEGDPVVYTFQKLGIFPSNADIIHFNKLSTAEFIHSIDSYSPWKLFRVNFGNTPAAKGHFIINAFDRNRQTVSGINAIYRPTRDTEADRPVSVAFYAGRIWYLMPQGVVYFTQTLTDIRKAGNCYQDADPTAEDINELVATDGGKVDLTGVAQALKLIPIRAEIAILADNGVWSISGEGDSTFSPVKQEIRKITSVGAIGAETVIEVEGIIFYWSEGGIYMLAADQVTGQLTAQNITETTIQTLFFAIPENGKKNARGFYDKQSKKILWVYNDTTGYDGINFKNKYNRVLVFDIVVAAFYTYSLDSSDNYPFLASLVSKSAGTFSTSTEDVTDSSGVIVTADSTNVFANITTTSSAAVKVKLLTFAETATDVWQYTFSEFKEDNMLDWEKFDSVGISYSSFIETGHDIVGNLLSAKDLSTGIYTFFERTEKNIVSNDTAGTTFDFPSSCLMQGQWHWTDSDASGRWSSKAQAYKLLRHYIPLGTGTFDYGFEVVQTINQIRGSGRALSIRFESEVGKDFHLLGWAIPYTAMTSS